MLKIRSHMLILYSSENVLSGPDTSILRLSILGHKRVRASPAEMLDACVCDPSPGLRSPGLRPLWEPRGESGPRVPGAGTPEGITACVRRGRTLQEKHEERDDRMCLSCLKLSCDFRAHAREGWTRGGSVLGRESSGRAADSLYQRTRTTDGQWSCLLSWCRVSF